MAKPAAPPVGETEKQLAVIWSELLGMAEINRDDDFFALGGHSLLATQVISRVRQELGVQLALRSLFEAATLQDFVASIEHSERAASMPVLRRVARAQCAGLRGALEPIAGVKLRIDAPDAEFTQFDAWCDRQPELVSISGHRVLLLEAGGDDRRFWIYREAEVVIRLDVNANRIARLRAAANESTCATFARGAIHCIAHDCDRCVDFIRELGLAAGDGIEARLERSERCGELVSGQHDGVSAQDVSDLPVSDCGAERCFVI